MSRATIEAPAEAARITEAALEAMRAFLTLTEEGAAAVEGSAISAGGSGYAPSRAGSPHARWTDFGRGRAEVDVGGLASALTNDTLAASAAEEFQRAARALVYAAYLTELRVHRLTFEARLQGREAAERAGSWAADGNTDAGAARRVIELSEAGDDIDDYLPRRPDLSGEWADAPTPLSLARELTGEEDPEPELMDAIAEAWDEGVSERFEAACLEEIARAAAC